MRPANAFSMPARDRAAVSRSLAESGLSARFRFWRGASGRRLVFSVYALDAAPAYAGAVVMAVRSTSSGDVPVWAGSVETAEEAALLPALFADAADHLHIHLLAGDQRDRQAVVEDLFTGIARH
jgi:hypothetical protein